MPWIMLTVKLPTKPSPPKMSMFWADTWPMENHIESQRKRLAYEYGYDNFDPDADDYYVLHGKEPNVRKTLKINYEGADLRVFAHECSILTPERMRDYVFGMPGEDLPSHDLVPSREADSLLLRAALETDLRGIYDAALIDGCTPAQAQQVAMGVNIEDDAIEFPNVGWYRCKSEYASMYCDDWEMEETPRMDEADWANVYKRTDAEYLDPMYGDVR